MDLEQIIAELQKDQQDNLANLRAIESELNQTLKKKIVLENEVGKLKETIIDLREKVKQAKFVKETNEIEIRLKTSEFWQNKQNRG